MGNWKIEIEGLGIHHNGREDDADALAKDFVRSLIAKGQKVSSARLLMTNGTTTAACWTWSPDDEAPK